ncbi:hypothetical protein CHH77_02260 [Shouchella clausii]|uniref:DUF5677 domain-containing protein n=1 Tax=Shouchella clausii TaxID=79880 RepID=UPI000BA4F8F7|nr:DUF5677 domain-containing protein [Shouchella clausii]PAE84961.1 hypothetical protein CHH77_02260 [Shouchella clausii]
MDKEIKEIFLEFCFDVERDSNFQNIEHAGLSNIFYHLYTKYKKTYILILDSFEYSTFDNPEIELIPMIRTLIETHINLCYVCIEGRERPDKVSRLYEQEEKFNKYIQGKQLNKLKREDRTEAVQKFIKDHYLGKEEPFVDRQFKSILGRSKTIGKERFYFSYYLPFNSFVHYDPSTIINYLSAKDGANVFGSTGERLVDHSHGISYCINIATVDVMRELTKFIYYNSGLDQSVKAIELFKQKFNT